MIKVFTAGVLIIFVLLITEMCRRQKLTFKYAAGWFIFVLLGLLGVIFDPYVAKLAAACGFIVTSNFIFFCLLIFFIILSLFLTTFLCQQNKRNDVMAQKIGLLDLEIQGLKENLAKRHG